VEKYSKKDALVAHTTMRPSTREYDASLSPSALYAKAVTGPECPFCNACARE
jgi:hypothetical protein